MLLTNGRIHTMDAAGTVVDSLVVRDGRVAFAGRRGDINLAAGEGTLDLGGRTVLPGLVDGHGHLMLLAKARLELSLAHAGSEEEIAGMVGDAALTVHHRGELGHRRHERKGHHLADEHHTLSRLPLDHPPNVEAQVHFLEVLVEERRRGQQVRVKKEERDQTHEVTATMLVESCSPWHVGSEDARVYLEIDHCEVSPVCHQKCSAQTFIPSLTRSRRYLRRRVIPVTR